MVVRSLFNQCIDGIQDKMMDGILVNVDDFPAYLRQMIFSRFPTYIDNETVENLPESLRRSEFFNHFDHIELLNFRNCDQHKILMSTILAEIERPGSSLASTLVSLKLRLCFVDRRPSSSIWQWLGFQKKPRFEVDIGRLIAACRNLRRLTLERCSSCWKCPDNSTRNSETTSSIDCGYALDEIMGAFETGGSSRAPLEELILCKFVNFDMEKTYYALESLQALHFDRCILSPFGFFRLTEPCQKTLLTLSLQDTHVEGCDSCWLFELMSVLCFREKTADVSTGRLSRGGADLPALTSLSINDSYWYPDYWKPYIDMTIRCLVSLETLRRVGRGKVCVYDTSKRGMIQMLADCLQTEVEVAFVFGGSFDYQRFLFAHELFGQRIVELHCHLDGAHFPEPAEYGVLIDQLTSIRVLVVIAIDDNDVEYFHGDRFLRRFFSDARRGAQLRQLKIYWDLQAETLQLLFQHCVNLELLDIRSHSCCWDDLPTITDEHLEIWAAHGAKPKQIEFGYNLTITADGVENLLRNCGGDLKAPDFLDERGRFIA